MSSHTILLEDGRWVLEDEWKHCNCILCQDDEAVIGIDQDYCERGMKLDKVIGEKTMKDEDEKFRTNCSHYLKRPNERAHCTIDHAVLYSCVYCTSFEEKHNEVSHPAHYTGLTIKGVSIECIDVIEALGLNFLLGNAFKYLWRAGKKTEDPKTDLKKSIWYITRSLD